MKGSSMRSSHGRVTSSRVSSTAPRPAAATASAGVAVLAEHDKQLLQQLAHDLAALLARKLLHRWQQHTADAKVDRARAKPMQKLLRCVACKSTCASLVSAKTPDSAQMQVQPTEPCLHHLQWQGCPLTLPCRMTEAEQVDLLLLCSKRKALRAWKTAMKLQPPSPVTGQPTAAVGKQPGPLERQLQPDPEQQQHLTRREQVAEQFHRLYRLHGCLQQWRGCAAAGVLARRMQETDRIMAQQQAEVIRKASSVGYLPVQPFGDLALLTTCIDHNAAG
jgi:hypothetical protein